MMLFASPLIREIEDKRPDSTSQIIKPSLRGGLPIFAFHVNSFFFLFAGRHDRTIMNCKMFLMLDLLFSIKPPKEMIKSLAMILLITYFIGSHILLPLLSLDRYFIKGLVSCQKYYCSFFQCQL